jgi:hypothetical protein
MSFMTRKLRFVFGLLGIAGCMVFILARAPQLYNGLWEDEIHYNYVPLHAPSFHQLRADVNWLYRPCLEYVLRKYVWFSSFGFSITEQRLALVALIYSFAHLVLWLFLPWTSYLGLRFLVFFLLGLCSVENAYSAEAQGYSFISLVSSIAFLTVWRSFLNVDRGKSTYALLLFLFSMFVYLNTHFFSWISACLLMGTFFLYVFLADQSDKWTTLRQLIGGCVFILSVSILLNKPAIVALLKNPPAQAMWHFHGLDALKMISQSWTWLGITFPIFICGSLFGAFHPERAKRYLWATSAVTLTVVKWLLIVMILGRSSYQLADRYLIMFIAPSLLVFMLGLESIILRLDHYLEHAGRVVSWLLVVFVVISNRTALKNTFIRADAGYKIINQTPQNYSEPYKFFEKIKSLKKPTLILSDHCYASDIPKMYTEFIGRQPYAPIEVLDTNGICETPESRLRGKFADFLSDYGSKGVVVFFYETGQNGFVPCPSSEMLQNRSKDFYCAGTIDPTLVSFKE